MSQLLAAVMNTFFAIGTYCKSSTSWNRSHSLNSCLVTPGTIEKFGRRSIMLWSAVVLGISMLIFTVMIALPNPTLATQWTAIAFIIIYNLAFGYGWVGCPWLYGPEVRQIFVKIDISPANQLTCIKDCAASVSPCCWSCGIPGRMALLVHHRVCRWDRSRSGWVENLDLANYILHHRSPVRLLLLS